MIKLQNEINAVVANKFKLNFRIPTLEKLKKMRLINRDMSLEEIQDAKDLRKKIDTLFKQIESGKYPLDKISQLNKVVG